ncbi:MAG: glutamate ABC transporter substrate-binding protein [Nakamurella sp.]
MKFRLPGLVGLTAVVALTLSACGSSDPAAPAAGASSVIDKIASDKKLTIGIKFDQPGLGLKNPDNTYSGFDVSVAKYVAKELGVEESAITFKETPSAARETALKNKEVDLILATYSITDKRKAEVSFAGPYFVAHQDLLIKADDAAITGPKAMDGKILCSVKGSTSALKIQTDYSKQVQLKEYGGYSDCVNALKTGAVDAVTTDDIILAGFAEQNAGAFKVVGEGFSDENYGVGLWKDDTKTRDAVNAAITKMQTDGSWKKALEEAVGKSGYTVPEPPAITEK